MTVSIKASYVAIILCSVALCTRCSPKCFPYLNNRFTMNHDLYLLIDEVYHLSKHQHTFLFSALRYEEVHCFVGRFSVVARLSF
jgi:hypothetical protein